MRLFFFLLIFIASCQDYNSNSGDKGRYGPVELDESDPNFRQAYTIIQNRCVSCHDHRHDAWAEFTSNSDWKASGLIVANDEGSELIVRIINSGEGSSNMPPGGSPLPDSEYNHLKKMGIGNAMKILVLLLALYSTSVAAYTNFIGHGYTSCLNCHFNPFGGGPLNDYGRVVSATLIGSDVLYPKTWNEEKLAYMSGFLFRKPKQNWLRTQVNYRGFKVVRNPGSSSAEESKWINMQADARVILKFGENDKFITVLNYGYAPLPNEVPEGTDMSKWRSREHYVGYRFTPKFGLYAGLMDKVFGIKVIEHIAFSRVAPQVTQNDQVHGVTAHYLGDGWELGAQGFVGNLSQSEDLRMKGFSTMIEKTIFDIHRIGASVSKSKNEYLELLSYSAHTRLNLKDGSAILAELGQTNKKTQNGSDDTTARFGLLQTYLRPWRGTYILANIEYYNRDITQDDYTLRWGPGIQYFLTQRTEFRFDLYDTRSFAPKSSTKDSWMYLLQTHIWF